MQRAHQLQSEEDTCYGSADFALHQSSEAIVIELNSEALQEHIQTVNALVETEADKQRQRKLKSVANKLAKEQEKLVKYEEQRENLGGRNSYSKTDIDATFMRSKADELLPQYNPQITTNHQFVLHATVHQTPVDNITLPAHLSELCVAVVPLVDDDWHPDATTDAGYGTEEVYAWLERHQMRAFVKYPLWHKEVTGELAKQTYRRENWTYDSAEDYFICPEQRRLTFVEEFSELTRTGYERIVRKYKCESCANCPVFSQCRGERAKAESNRTVQVSRELERYKAEAKDLLASEEGQHKRSRHGTEVETPFGNIKYNMGHRRFVLRGLAKVETEFKLLCIGHNLRKVKCEVTGEWKVYYAQRAAKRAEKSKKRA